MMETSHDKGQSAFLAEIVVGDDGFSFSSPIQQALAEAELELADLKETIDTVATLRTNCDKLDYALAASSGALCGLIDIFLVGSPLNSPSGYPCTKPLPCKVATALLAQCPLGTSANPAF